MAWARVFETIEARTIEDGRVLALTLNQPRANVLTVQMMDELREALAQRRGDAALKMVLLRGAGGTFSYGASVAEHKKDRARAMLMSFHDLVRDIATFPVPVTALVEGKCLGGAFEVVLACHVVFATENAVFACPEVKLGVVPPVLAVLGASRLGGALAERLLLTGGELDARRAERAGFVAEIVEDGTDPFAHVLAWYERALAPLSAFALREATFAARHGSGVIAALGEPLDAAEKRYVDKLLPSHDANEGIEAFLAKRAPRWVDA
jgi:cyclohexa-1,5-dienecarbonyl-CoA hydratase